MSKELIDKSKTGKVRPWQAKKIENLRYADYLRVLRYKKANGVKDCAEILRFKKIDDGTLRLYQTWFCKSKLCPMCNWRRSMKNSNQVKNILTEAIQKEPTGRFIFLTLTEKNALDGAKLKERLHALTGAFNKMMRYKKIDKNLLGYVRSTELTVNQNGSYHQHLHVLLFVKSGYFAGSENYISQSEWIEFWQKALKINYKPVVHVEIVKPKKNDKKNKNSLQSSAEEVAKYQVKSADYMTKNDLKNQKIVDDLEHALAGTRQISYGGILKKIKKDLQLDDVENGNLVDVGDEEKTKNDEVEMIIAKWNFEQKNYFLW